MKSRLATAAVCCALLFCAAAPDLSAQTTQSAIAQIQVTPIDQQPAPVPKVEESPEYVPLSVEDLGPAYGPPTVASVPECGGMLPNGQPQAACPPKSATKVGASQRDCPSGSFFDLTSWSCWQCPAKFSRSAAPVVSEQACSQPTAAGLKRTYAKLVGGRCPSGSFFDIIRGGECWSCPSGYRRTTFSVEDKGWACETGANIFELKKSAATFVKKGVCEPGSIFDPRNGGECWTCPTGTLRTVFPINEASACETPAGIAYKPATKTAPFTCKTSEIFDPIDGGTCWTCPEGYKRNTSRVDAADACAAGTFIWKTAAFREPGLFGLPGAAEVLLEVTQANHKLVQEAIRVVADKLAKSSGVSLADALANEKRLFASDPQHSIAAHGVVLARLIAVAAEPGTASAAEKLLAKSFADYVIAKRTYIAEDMLAAYDNWYDSNEYWREKRHLNQGLAGAFSYGTVPPSFDSVGKSASIGLSVVATASSVGLSQTADAMKFVGAAKKVGILGDVIGAVLSISAAGWTPSTSSEQIAMDTGRAAIEGAVSIAIGQLLEVMAATPVITASVAGSTTAMAVSTLSSLVSSVAPPLIVAAEMIFLGVAIDQFKQIIEARPILLKGVLNAKVDPDLARMTRTKDGIGQIEGFWSFATEGGKAPSRGFMAAYTPVAQQAAN